MAWRSDPTYGNASLPSLSSLPSLPSQLAALEPPLRSPPNALAPTHLPPSLPRVPTRSPPSLSAPPLLQHAGADPRLDMDVPTSARPGGTQEWLGWPAECGVVDGAPTPRRDWGATSGSEREQDHTLSVSKFSILSVIHFGQQPKKGNSLSGLTGAVPRETLRGRANVAPTCSRAVLSR